MRRIFLTSLLLGNIAFALDANDQVIQLGPMHVNTNTTENRGHLINPKQFQSIQSGDLSDALEGTLASISLIRKADAANDVILEGLYQDNISVLNDGRKLYPACSNRMDPPISHVSQSQIKSIKIESGAFDLKYGGSLGGSINVSTREIPQSYYLNTRVLFGNFSRQQYALTSSYGGLDWSHSFSASYQQSDAYEDGDGVKMTDMPDTSSWKPDDYQDEFRDDKAYEKQNYLLKLEHEITDHSQLLFSFQWNDDNNVLYPGLRMDSEHNRTEQYGMKYTVSTQSELMDQIEFDLYYNDVEHDMTDSRRLSAIETAMGLSRGQYVLDRSYYMKTFATSKVKGFRLDFKGQYKEQLLEYGLDVHQRNWDSDNRLGAGMNESDEIFNNMIPDVVTDNYGLYFQGTKKSQKWQIDYGVRFDRYENEVNDSLSFLESQLTDVEEKTDNALSAKAMLHYHISESLSIWSGLGYVQRTPNAQERYISLNRPMAMPNWIGNPDLEMVRNTEFRIGSLYSKENFSFQVEAYYKQLDEYIYPVKLTPSDTASLSKNAQSYTGIDAHIYGANLNMNWNITEQWNLSSSVSWLRGEKDDKVLNNDNDILGELPPLRLLLSINYKTDKYFASLQFEAADSQDRVDEAIGEFELDSYQVLNFRMSYNILDELQIQTGVDNIFDESYALQNAYVRNPFSSYSLITEPGRSFFIALNYEFGQ